MLRFIPRNWRKVLWAYRSAAGGWYISIFQHGFHFDPFRKWRVRKGMDIVTRDARLAALDFSFVADRGDYVELRDNLTGEIGWLAKPYGFEEWYEMIAILTFQRSYPGGLQEFTRDRVVKIIEDRSFRTIN